MADILLTRKTTISSFYRAWVNMKTRCTNPKDKNFSRYGQRGINYDDKWKTFDGFIEDMYDTYRRGLTLDRIDNNKGYSKENCRWATMRTQSNNRRSNKLITINNVTKTLEQWVRVSNLKSSTVRQRLYVYKWSAEQALGFRKHPKARV